MTPASGKAEGGAELLELLSQAVCPHCANAGYVEGAPLAMCCKRPTGSGECCGSPVPEQTQEQCQWCAERAAHLATAANGPGEADAVPVSKTVIDFLCGAGPLEGVHFGDDHPTERGKYWWRKYLYPRLQYDKESRTIITTPQPEMVTVPSHDEGCICHGNWRLLVSECKDLFGKHYKDSRTGEIFTFIGLVHADDDYYYGMWSHCTKESRLISCVMSIEQAGLTRLLDAALRSGGREE